MVTKEEDPYSRRRKRRRKQRRSCRKRQDVIEHITKQRRGKRNSGSRKSRNGRKKRRKINAGLKKSANGKNLKKSWLLRKLRSWVKRLYVTDTTADRVWRLGSRLRKELVLAK